MPRIKLGSRWGKIGEQTGQAMGQGVLKGMQSRWQREGIRKVMELISQPGKKSPMNLLQAAADIENPYARQAAMELAGQLMPYYTPKAMGPGQVLKQPLTGEQVGEPVPVQTKTPTLSKLGKLFREQAVTTPGSSAYNKYEKAIEKEITKTESEKGLTKLGKLYRERAKHKPGSKEYNEYSQAIEKEITRQEKDDKVTLTQIAPDGIAKRVLKVKPERAKKLLAQTNKDGSPKFVEGDVKNLPQSAKFTQTEQKQLRDHIAQIIHKNAFANLDDTAQKEVLTFTERAIGLTQQGVNKYSAARMVIYDERKRQALTDIPERKKGLTDVGMPESLGEQVVPLIRQALEYGADVEGEIIPALREKGWKPKEIHKALEEAGYKKRVAVSDDEKLVEKLLMGE